MKNKDIIEYIVIFSVAAILLYRKYGKKFLAERKDRKNLPQKEASAFRASEDDYEPYSGKGK